MTAEESIKILENGSWWDNLNPDASDADMNPLHEALDVAIAALRTQQEADVDAVKVVRCGHCDYRKMTENAYKVFGWNCTNKHSPCRGRIVGDTDFCPYGKRRTDNAIT